MSRRTRAIPPLRSGHAELLAAYANDKILHHLRCASRVASGLPAAEVHDVVQNIFAVAPGAFIAVVRQRMPGYREVDAEILLTGHASVTPVPSGLRIFLGYRSTHVLPRTARLGFPIPRRDRFSCAQQSTEKMSAPWCDISSPNIVALSQRYLNWCRNRGLCVGSVGRWAVGVPLAQNLQRLCLGVVNERRVATPRARGESCLCTTWGCLQSGQ